jgi:hypothetical protein
MAFNRLVLHFYFYFRDVFEDDFGHLCFFISVANPTHNPHTHPHTQQAGESRSLLHMQKEGTFKFFIHFQVSTKTKTKTRKLNLSLTLFQNWWLFLCLILFSCCRFFRGSFNSEPPFYSLFSSVSISLFLSHTQAQT